MAQKQSGQQESNRGGNRGSQGQRDSSSSQPDEHQPEQRGQQGGQGQQETPEQWLEEHSLGDPTETGNTITGENEY